MIDLTNLNSLLGNDRATVMRFLQTIRDQLPIHLTSLKNAVHLHDRQEVNIMAHNIKSHLRYLGNMEVAECAYQIEHYSDETVTDWKNISEMVMLLEKGVEKMVEDISNYLEG